MKAGLTLRDVAHHVGFTHVYLGEVERGLHHLNEEHWVPLTKAIPGLTLEMIRAQSIHDRPLQLDLTQAPPTYQHLGLLLARRLTKNDLAKREVADLMKILDPE